MARFFHLVVKEQEAEALKLHSLPTLRIVQNLNMATNKTGDVNT